MDRLQAQAKAQAKAQAPKQQLVAGKQFAALIALAVTAAGTAGYFYLASTEKSEQSQIQTTSRLNAPSAESALPNPTFAALPNATSVPDKQNAPLASDSPGVVTQGWIGVRIQQVTPEIANSLRLKFAKGALVVGLFDNSPAFAAGIKLGDVILSFNGEQIGGPSDVVRKVKALGPGKKADLILWRHGSEESKLVTVGQYVPGGRQLSVTN